MEPWVLRALEKWPDVPALFGWLGLDRRGRWRIRGELISRPQIIDTLNPNYAADAQGRWYFQNGPQRGYVTLESAPLVLRTDGEDRLLTHTGLRVEQARAAFLDQNGALWLDTEHGPAVLEGDDLHWALARLYAGAAPLDEEELARALALPSGAAGALRLETAGCTLPVTRLDTGDAPAQLGFVRDPQPLPGEA